MALVLFDDRVAGRRCRVVATERSDGDVHPRNVPLRTLRSRQRAVSDEPWCLADQVHGRDVWDVDRLRSGEELVPADVVAGRPFGAPVAVWSADCATLVLLTDDGRVTGVHAGWRGLACGAIDAAVDRAVRDAASVVAVVRGPVIGSCCYAFGSDELAEVADGVGVPASAIEGTTRDGRPALDVAAAVDAALRRRGLAADAVARGCTGCDRRWWSHRVGAAPERQALIGWWP